ncbi:MAG: hypothetical protein M1825_002092 [Sarcosagium campestre]|nr:MAG: hypothetical protein M1825_002092 [Sarcosagium campestre]
MASGYGSDKDDDSASSTSNDEQEPETVESLVAGRDKRATAGNRLSTLLDQEADDELELLFAEDEGDVEFEDEDEAGNSDVQLGSSDEDDDDQGPSADKGDEDLEGERELQKQTRTERQAKKRKAQSDFFKPPALRKKVKIDPTSATDPRAAPASKPKKKPERISWMPTTDEGQTRSSARRSTVENKAVIRARLKKHEERRISQIATMEAAAKRKDELKPKELTQADKLAEAARTEQLNSKSLNRWEEAEKKRVDDQKARLAALQNRHLDGPVITWWSGVAEWVNGKLSRIGSNVKVGDAHGKIEDASTKDKGRPQSPSTKLASTEEAPNTRKDSEGPQTDSTSAATSANATPDISSLPTRMKAPDQQPLSNAQPRPAPSTSSPTAAVTTIAMQLAPTWQSPKPLPPAFEYTSRNLLILENFDPVAVRNREVQQLILFKRRATRAQKPIQEQCVITSLPARFRDPSTGLAYLNAYAYREIQKCKAGAPTWSNLLGCYVGPAGIAARGVPERFTQRPEPRQQQQRRLQIAAPPPQPVEPAKPAKPAKPAASSSSPPKEPATPRSVGTRRTRRSGD